MITIMLKKQSMKPPGIHGHLHQPLAVILLRLDPQLSGSGVSLRQLGVSMSHFVILPL